MLKERCNLVKLNSCSLVLSLQILFLLYDYLKLFDQRGLKLRLVRLVDADLGRLWLDLKWRAWRVLGLRSLKLFRAELVS